jgi:ribose transport system substrate-binding protein
LGDVTIQVAREAAAGKPVPAFVDAGTALVTSDKVADYPHTALFAEYRPQVLNK